MVLILPHWPVLGLQGKREGSTGKTHLRARVRMLRGHGTTLQEFLVCPEKGNGIFLWSNTVREKLLVGVCDWLYCEICFTAVVWN